MLVSSNNVEFFEYYGFLFIVESELMNFEKYENFTSKKFEHLQCNGVNELNSIKNSTLLY